MQTEKAKAGLAYRDRSNSFSVLSLCARTEWNGCIGQRCQENMGEKGKIISLYLCGGPVMDAAMAFIMACTSLKQPSIDPVEVPSSIMAWFSQDDHRR